MTKILTILALLCLASTAYAQSQLLGQSLRIAPQSSVPSNLSTGRVGLWSPSTGGNANLLQWRLSSGSDDVFILGAQAQTLTLKTIGDVLIFNDGSAQGLSGANTGKLRYNNSTHQFEASVNGGSYSSFGNMAYATVDNAGTALTQRSILNFTGSGVSCADNAGATRTDCTINGAVTSVSNSDGTLTISPTTGAVVGSLALGHSNTWTVGQTFSSGITTGTVDNSGALNVGTSSATSVVIGNTSAAITEKGGALIQRAGKAASYTATANDFLIGVTDTSVARTITLPSASPAGTIYCVKDESGSATAVNSITIKASTSNVDGQSGGFIITAPYSSICVYSDGSNYFTY